MAATASLKGFAIAALILEVFFAIIYAFTVGYARSQGFDELNGLLTALFLSMLLLIGKSPFYSGFGLVGTYLRKFAVGGMVLTFIILAFTIQWYFLMRLFWTGVNVADATNPNKLGTFFYYLRLTRVTTRSSTVTAVAEFTLAEAVACAISMFVGLFSALGRVGPLETLTMCFFGIFGYALNESAFWRLFINDNGYGMRIFLFGSTMGLVASLILGKKEKTARH